MEDDVAIKRLSHSFCIWLVCLFCEISIRNPNDPSLMDPTTSTAWFDESKNTTMDFHVGIVNPNQEGLGTRVKTLKS